MPLSKSPQSTVPSDDPGAAGRSGGSRTHAPAATPAAPRGREAAARPGDIGRSQGADRSGMDGRGEASATGLGHTVDGDGPAGHLLGGGERDRLADRLHHALAGFVDAPRDAVAEAAGVLEEVEQQLLASLRDRRAALQAGWQRSGDPNGPRPDTEQLRLTLQTYREVTERLLRA
ncbi:hypothetical protein ACIPPS_12235 [Streptomyces sp. NPDC090127]|uniref:hypothetical protein n=1 Tax=Streptomyces sp. NPDC090127 TaxID=3365953 RepID=UPI0037FFD2CD